MLPSRPVEIVQWMDASMDNPHWQEKPFPKCPTVEENTIFSVGFVIHDTDDFVVLLQSMGKDTCAF